jgi:hypothetical protein
MGSSRFGGEPAARRPVKDAASRRASRGARQKTSVTVVPFFTFSFAVGVVRSTVRPGR